MVLHVETTPGVAASVSRQLESLGYALDIPLDERNGTAHRFRRDSAIVDLTAAATDVVDVLVADHAAPRAAQQLRGRRMVAIEGGTQALRRTINATLQILPGVITTVSVPRPLGAVILKAAAYRADSRDRERHLQDAALLLSVIPDPYAAREELAGSDRSRLLTLERALPENSRWWRTLPEPWRTNGQVSLRILTAL
ncbi:hypothetical protein AADG42_14225 [Ammonicoccus fulvus]|uniref:Uncharacterized protein n=1 Tax=Ammonicoccus fulvus TaxID=3138240 RepID=A0ABZ3FTI9_9ACTN